MSLRFLSVNMMSEITGIDRRTIRKRIEGLVGSKGIKNGTYYDAFEALPRLYHPEGTKLDISRHMANESLLLERAKREKIELDVKRIRGEYISIDEVCKALEKEYSFVRAQLRSLPSKFAKPLAIITDPNEIQRTSEEYINECLAELVADQKYGAMKDEIEQSRIQIDTEQKEDDASNSATQLGGLGGHLPIPESGVELTSGEMEDEQRGGSAGPDVGSDGSEGEEDYSDGSDSASEDGASE